MLKRFFAVLAVLTVIFSFSACKKDGGGHNVTNNAVIPPQTQIANEFAAQLPEFEFSESVVESYDESLKYSFSVKCSEREYKKYLDEIKDAGFVNGYPEQAPVSGNGYYKASDSDKYMVEIVYKTGILTVYVTRP